MGFGFRWWFGLHCCVYGLGWRLDSLQSQLFTGIMWLGPGSDGCTPAAGMHHRQHADKMEYAGGRWGMRLSFVGGMRPTLPAAGSSCSDVVSGASVWCFGMAATAVCFSRCRKRHFGVWMVLQLGSPAPVRVCWCGAHFCCKVLLVVCCSCHVLCVDEVWPRLLQFCRGPCRKELCGHVPQQGLVPLQWASEAMCCF
jgi:hypothetical protein